MPGNVTNSCIDDKSVYWVSMKYWQRNMHNTDVNIIKNLRKLKWLLVGVGYTFEVIGLLRILSESQCSGKEEQF